MSVVQYLHRRLALAARGPLRAGPSAPALSTCGRSEELAQAMVGGGLSPSREVRKDRPFPRLSPGRHWGEHQVWHLYCDDFDGISVYFEDELMEIGLHPDGDGAWPLGLREAYEH